MSRAAAGRAGSARSRPAQGWEAISDTEWALLARHLGESADGETAPGKGRPRLAARRCFDGCLWLLWSGGPWKSVPVGYGSRVTLWRRVRAWRESGRLATALLAFLAMRRPVERERWVRALLEDRSVLGLAGRARSRWSAPEEPDY